MNPSIYHSHSANQSHSANHSHSATRSLHIIGPSLGVAIMALTMGCSNDKKPAPVAKEPVAQEQQSSLLAVGVAAPDFTTEAHDGMTVTMSDANAQPTVLYFYPKDETRG